jgi:hypothetical protein
MVGLDGHLADAGAKLFHASQTMAARSILTLSLPVK